MPYTVIYCHVSLAHIPELHVHIPIIAEKAVNAICQVGIWVSSFLLLAASKYYKCKCECVCMCVTWAESKHHKSKFSSRRYWAPGRHRRQTHSHPVAILPILPCPRLTSVCRYTHVCKPTHKMHCKMHLVTSTDAHQTPTLAQFGTTEVYNSHTYHPHEFMDQTEKVRSSWVKKQKQIESFREAST